jgi:hypothetical protein
VTSDEKRQPTASIPSSQVISFTCFFSFLPSFFSLIASSHYEIDILLYCLVDLKRMLKDEPYIVQVNAKVCVYKCIWAYIYTHRRTVGSK